jgi:SH3-like domain-containing protein
MNAEALLEAYGADRLGREYGYRDPEVYTLTGYHRGQDVRKQNREMTASVPTDVVAIDGGRIVYLDRPNGFIELTAVIDTGRPFGAGKYESHSHLAGAIVKVGDHVESGEKLARNADRDERPGTAWGGPHDHITITDYIDGAWMKRPEYDPAHFIKAARLAAADAIEAAKPGEVYVVTTATYLRSEKTTVSASKLMRLPVGKRLRVLKIEGDWATVRRLDGRTAYVWASRLTKAKLTATRDTVLRRMPTKNSRVVLKLAKGKRVNVIGRRVGNRVKVERGGRGGWAYRKHVR